MASNKDRYQAVEEFRGGRGWFAGVIDTANFIGSDVEQTDDLASAESLARSMNAKGARLTNHVVMVYRLSQPGVYVYAEGGLSKAEAESKVEEALADSDIYCARIQRNGLTVAEKTIRKWVN